MNYQTLLLIVKLYMAFVRHYCSCTSFILRLLYHVLRARSEQIVYLTGRETVYKGDRRASIK